MRSRAYDYGAYTIIEPSANIAVGGPGMGLDDVALWLNTPEGEEVPLG